MTQKDQIIRILKDTGFLRYRDIVSHEIHPQSLKRMVESGELTRIGRGLYALPDTDFQSSYQSFAEACTLVPLGVICLLSALAYHEISTQSPHQVWMAIPEKAKKI
ncbi:type IV toxin-antitoxin system AbiEi family antitoxin domain-containing protein, partial [bacterium]|nr:type IV toxin-antitoxin system AbiEi family antitoxin domain-containing protein [bacterium]